MMNFIRTDVRRSCSSRLQRELGASARVLRKGRLQRAWGASVRAPPHDRHVSAFSSMACTAKGSTAGGASVSWSSLRSARTMLTGSPEFSGKISFSHNHFYVDTLRDLEEYKRLEAMLNSFSLKAKQDTTGFGADINNGAAAWDALRQQYGDPLSAVSHQTEYKAAGQDLVEQLLVGLGWRITGAYSGDGTRTLVVTSRDPQGVKFVITAHANKRIDGTPVAGIVSAEPAAAESGRGVVYSHFDAAHLDRFGQCHYGRQGCAVLGFRVEPGELESVRARYAERHPKLLLTDAPHSYADGRIKVLEVYAYYKGEVGVTDPDRGTVLRFMEVADETRGDFCVLPGVSKVEATFDEVSQSVFCDHWVSNVHSRTGFLDTLSDTLGFSPKVDFNAGVVAAGEAQIESTVTGNTSVEQLETPQVALKDQSQIYLPINNALSEVGHVNTFLKEIGQGVQHVASRVEDLIRHISRCNDYRKMTGAGLSFLQIPPSYYGRLSPNELASALGIEVSVAEKYVEILRREGIVDASDVVDLNTTAEKIAAALPDGTPGEVIKEILQARYSNLYKLLRDQVTEEQYLQILRNNILVDVQGGDLLMQIFTSKILTRSSKEEGPFLEFIQRVCSDRKDPTTGRMIPIKPGCGGFGIRNFLTLFLSIEVTEASMARELARSNGDEIGVKFAQRMVDAFTEQLNESNPILTQISDAMTAEGVALERGDRKEAARWAAEKDKGQQSLMEVSLRYKELTKSIREEQAMRKAARQDGAAPQRDWNVRCGVHAGGIKNPIREIMDTMGGKSNPNKSLISLAQGDPTCYPHLRPPNVAIHEVVNQVYGGHANGYQPSQGHMGARVAIADEFSVPGQPPLTADDVFMTIGCSEALSHAIAALAFKGANMLLPRPGFPLYHVLCDYHGVECRYYDLKPEQNWEIDIGSLRALADENTTAVLVNNPSNPCGAVFSRAHLTDVARVAGELRLPIIADEVYHGMAFGAEPFVALAEVMPRTVPVISVCALSKRWLAPGWRVGWLTVHDMDGILKKAGVPETLLKLCQVSLGPTALIAAAIPRILEAVPKDWVADVLVSLRTSAEVCIRRCNAIPGVEVASDPQGAMYFMMRLRPDLLEGIDNDVDFARDLLKEESIAVLPGQCFGYPNYARVVFAAPVGTLEEAWDRIEVFCRRRYVGP